MWTPASFAREPCAAYTAHVTSAPPAQEDMRLGHAVVSLNFQPADVIRQAYAEHQRIGLPGTFGQYLLARKLIDDQQLARARRRVQESASTPSGRWGPESTGELRNPLAPPPGGSGRLPRVPVPPPPPALPRSDLDRTVDFDAVISPGPGKLGSGLSIGQPVDRTPRGGPGEQPRVPAAPKKPSWLLSTMGYDAVIETPPAPEQPAPVAAPPPPPRARLEPPKGEDWLRHTIDYDGVIAAPGPPEPPPRRPEPAPAPAPVPESVEAKLASIPIPELAPPLAPPLAPRSAPAAEPASEPADPPSADDPSGDVLRISRILSAPPLAPAAGEDYSQDESATNREVARAKPPKLDLTEDHLGALPERPPTRDSSRDSSKDGPAEASTADASAPVVVLPEETRSGTGPALKVPKVAKSALQLAEDPETAFFAKPQADEDPEAIGPQPKVGEMLGDFELIDVVGEGGMGYVFEGKRKDAPGRRYAVKVLQPGKGSNHHARRVRFQREVETLRQLDHKNLVRVYGCGRREGWDWYAMDFIEGRDLSKLLAEHRLSPQQKLDVFQAVCEGIAYAHKMRVVHRDLKPSNVRVTSDLQVKVLDFGLAKMEDEGEQQEALTRTGAALGTPFYMAPEQIRNAAHVDSRADVFALGVMLYETMTGKRPFLGATAGEVVEKVLNHEPPRLRQVNSHIHPDIEAICAKAMEKDAKRRYENAGELLEDLQQHRKGKGVSREGAFGLANRWLAKHATGFVTGVLVASAVWGVVLAFLLLK